MSQIKQLGFIARDRIAIIVNSSLLWDTKSSEALTT